MRHFLINNIGFFQTYDLADLELRIVGVDLDETTNSNEKLNGLLLTPTNKRYVIFVVGNVMTLIFS